MVQLHKRFTDSQVKELIERYLREEIERDYIQEVLGIGKKKNRGQTYTFEKLMSMEISRQGAGSSGKQAFCQKCRRDPGLCFRFQIDQNGSDI